MADAKIRDWIVRMRESRCGCKNQITKGVLGTLEVLEWALDNGEFDGSPFRTGLEILNERHLEAWRAFNALR